MYHKYDKSQIFSGEPPHGAIGDIAAERRQRIAAEQAALEERKRRDLGLQTAMESSPETRISLWERRHGMSLPRDTSHPVLAFIARSTGLEIEQVRAEQRRRAQTQEAGSRTSSINAAP
jgi:hypothetical protein